MNVFTLFEAATEGDSAFTGVQAYPLVLPNDAALPAVTYQIVSNVSEPTFSSSGPQKMRVQFDCWAATYASAQTIRNALIADMNGFRGPLEDGSLVSLALLEQEIDFFVQEALQYRLLVEFHVHYNLS